jgi:hypothetical protein
MVGVSDDAVIIKEAIHNNEVAAPRGRPASAEQKILLGLQRPDFGSEGNIVTHVIQHARQRLYAFAAVLIALHAEGFAQFRRVGQVEIRAVVRQHAMTAPRQHFTVLTIQFIEVIAYRVVQMNKQFGFNFLPGLTKRTISGRLTQLPQRFKHFVERVLERKFMPSQN